MSNVRALAAGAITLSRSARAAHAAAGEPIVVVRKHGSALQLARSVRLGPLLKRRARPGLLQPRCRLRAKCRALARLAQGRFPQSCRVACDPPDSHCRSTQCKRTFTARAPNLVSSPLKAGWAKHRRRLVAQSSRPPTTSALTLPSKGRPTSGFASCRPPLMSNVGRHRAAREALGRHTLPSARG